MDFLHKYAQEVFKLLKHKTQAYIGMLSLFFAPLVDRHLVRGNYPSLISKMIIRAAAQ